MRNTWIARGTQKPLFGAQINPAHPFARGLLMACLFDRGGEFPYFRPTFIDAWIGPSPRNGPTLIVGGATQQRTSVVSQYLADNVSCWTGNAEGSCLRLANRFSKLDLGEPSFLPTTGATLLIVSKRVLQATPPLDGHGCIVESGFSGTTAFRFVAPFDDGNVYWDFGGTAGANRLIASGLSFPDIVPDRWVLPAGRFGSSIWRNGVKVASQSTAITRTNGTQNLTLNGAIGDNGGEGLELNFFQIIDHQWPDDLCRWWSAEPYAHLYSEATLRRWWFINAAAGPPEGLSINGVLRTPLFETLERIATTNAVDTFSCDIVSEDGSYWPEEDDELYFVKDGELLFGGWVTTPLTRGLGGHGCQPINTSLTAEDFSNVTEGRYVTETFAAGMTLKQIMQVLVTYFAADGIGLDAAQVDGPTIAEAITYVYRKATEVLDELSVKTGYLWVVDYNKVLRMTLPGSIAAPFDVDEGDMVDDGDIEVEPTRNQYANQVIVFLAPQSVSNYTEAWTGDGTTVAFALATVTTVGQTRGLVTNNAVEQTLSEVGGGGTWELDTSVSPQVVTKVTGGAPSNGVAITLVVFTGTLTLTAQADDVPAQAPRPIGKGLQQLVIPAPTDATTLEQLQALADGYLATHSVVSPQIVRYETHTAGLKPGQTQHIVVTWRHIDADFLITDVVLRNDRGNRLRYFVTAIEGDRYQGGFRDTYRKWDGAAVAVGA